MLEAFHDRLRHLCAHDGQGAGLQRDGLIRWQAQQARALADKLGILKRFGTTWDEWRASDPDLKFGSEHIFECAPGSGLVGKITIPGKFGLTPQVIAHPTVNLRNDPAVPGFRRALEFVPATPLEYLQRWLDANALFHDDVKLVSVVEWQDGRLSFGITQPQYDGEPAPLQDITLYFEASGWKWIADPAGGEGHLLFFHYPQGVLAVDALPRNCFLHDGTLLPFDVILCRPDAEIEEFLSLYPG